MYWIRPYTLVVRYFGLIEAHGLHGNKAVHEDWRPKEPSMYVLRFWTMGGLMKYSERSQVQDFKRESTYVYSCAYAEDGSMNSGLH